MSYYLKAYMPDSYTNYLQISEIELYNGATKITGLQCVYSTPNYYNDNGANMLNGSMGDMTAFYASTTPVFIIKSTVLFDTVKFYGDPQGNYGVKTINYYTLKADSDPSVSDSGWSLKATGDYPNVANYIATHTLGSFSNVSSIPYSIIGGVM